MVGLIIYFLDSFLNLWSCQRGIVIGVEFLTLVCKVTKLNSKILEKFWFLLSFAVDLTLFNFLLTATYCVLRSLFLAFNVQFWPFSCF